MCKRDLTPRPDAYGCESCRRTYPVVLGIPDLRVYPDPHLSFAEDHHKGRQVEEQASRLRFAELLEFYWEHVSTPPTPIDLRRRFIRHVVDDDERAARLPLGTAGGHSCLDVGCGASALPKVLGGRFATVFATDIAFRWLVLARKRLDEAGVGGQLVCCCADRLPFRDRTFDLLTAVSLLEHTANAQAVVDDCARVTRECGRIFLLCTNRFSLAPEPHVRIWGLGFLPRGWMPSVVRWRRGLSYDKFHLLSLRQVRRALHDAGFSNPRFHLPEIRPPDLEGRGALERGGARLFQSLGNIAAIRPLLLRLAPIIQVSAERPPADAPSRAA
jgi:ubiquinone/menaquinone biosynthesis C-methylase UbiE